MIEEFHVKMRHAWLPSYETDGAVMTNKITCYEISDPNLNGAKKVSN